MIPGFKSAGRRHNQVAFRERVVIFACEPRSLRVDGVERPAAGLLLIQRQADRLIRFLRFPACICYQFLYGELKSAGIIHLNDQFP